MKHETKVKSTAHEKERTYQACFGLICSRFDVLDESCPLLMEVRVLVRMTGMKVSGRFHRRTCLSLC